MRFVDDRKCFMVAEISANHGQVFKRAVTLVREAKKCGADAVKFQAYTPDTLSLDVDNRYFRIKHSEWGGQTVYSLYKKAYTPWKWLKALQKITRDLGMMFFATAFDKTSVDFLEELRVPVHKVASFELVDLPLIEYMAKTKKPLILSTGMATAAEIQEAVDTARTAGAPEIVLLKCVSCYPALPEDMNLLTIPHMQKKFKCPVGLSDHTAGTAVSLTAAVLGACMIEKHLTLSRAYKTPDSFFSVEPHELRDLIAGVRVSRKAMGKIHYGLTEKERQSRVFRRSLFVLQDIPAGGVFTEKNIGSIRPAAGMAPKYIKDMLGKRARRALAKGTPLRPHLADRDTVK